MTGRVYAAVLVAALAAAPAAHAAAPPGPWDAFNLAPASRTVAPVAPAGAVTLAPGEYATYDFGKEVGGFVNLRFGAGTNSQVGLTYSEWSTYATPTKSDSSNGGSNNEPPVVYAASGSLDTGVNAPATLPAAPALSGASWIWNTPGASSGAAQGTIYLRKTFTVADPAAISAARLRVNVDDSHVTYVNGHQVAVGNGIDAWRTSQLADVKSYLVAGTNSIAIQATNTSAGASGVIAKLDLGATSIVTDASWKASTDHPDGWNTTAFDDSSWANANVAAAYGSGPWGTVADPGNGTDGRAWKPNSLLRGGFRYLTVRNPGPSPVTIDSASVRITFTPDMADLKAYPNYFYSSDPLLNRVWYAGAYTVQTNIIANDQGRVWGAPSVGWDNSGAVGEAGDSVLVDGAKRDRTVWPGDLGISLPTDFASLDDLTSVRNAIQTLFNHQAASGALPYAGPQVNFIGNSDAYHMWTLIGTATYVSYSSDKAWLDGIWPKYKSALAYITAKIGSDNLLNVTASSDWARANSGGKNIEAEAIMYRTLTSCVTAATTEGDSATANSCATKAAALKAAVAPYWDAAAGLYRDTPTSSVYPQDGNSLAVWYGLTDHGVAISNALTARWTALGAPTPEKSATSINPFPGSMETLAHFAAGQDQQGLDLIRREWGYMLNAPFGTGTFWEGYKTDGTSDYSDSYVSSSHGWSTGPTSALTFYVLGILPGDSGYSLIPHPGDLRHVEGQLTTAQGVITQSYDADPQTGTFSEHFSGPKLDTVAVPTFGKAITVRLDNAPVTPTRTDSAYAYFDVPAGTHALASCPVASCGTLDVGGSVPATLALTLGAPASFGAFIPGVARDYTASTTATVGSTAGDATLTVTDPSATAPGHLVNGSFVLPQPLRWDTPIKTWNAPVANEVVPVTFHQAIAATDPLRTGSYGKTLTFTLSTTTP